MQRIGVLDAYVEVTEDDIETATFVHPVAIQDQSRLIKMRILAPGPVNLWLVPLDWDYETEKVVGVHDEPDFVKFLAHVAAGFEELEFRYTGTFGLRVVGGAIWLDTADNAFVRLESLAPESFARPLERPEVDPRILEVEQKARQNTRRLEEQMAADRAERDELKRLLQNVIASQAAGTGVQVSVPSNDGGQVPSGEAPGDNGGSGTGEGGTEGVSESNA